jgi:hypothetical protein
MAMSNPLYWKSRFGSFLFLSPGVRRMDHGPGLFAKKPKAESRVPQFLEILFLADTPSTCRGSPRPAKAVLLARASKH